MKKINLFLVLILIACYSGFGSRTIYPSVTPSDANCHSINKENRSQDKHYSDATVFHLNKDAINPGASRCCLESLNNAPQNDHLLSKDLILYASLHENSAHQIDDHIKSILSVNIREHDPPDLYVSNSTLLL